MYAITASPRRRLANSLTSEGLTLGDGSITEIEGVGKLYPSILIPFGSEVQSLGVSARLPDLPVGGYQIYRVSSDTSIYFYLPSEGHYRLYSWSDSGSSVGSEVKSPHIVPPFFGLPENGIPGGEQIRTEAYWEVSYGISRRTGNLYIFVQRLD